MQMFDYIAFTALYDALVEKNAASCGVAQW